MRKILVLSILGYASVASCEEHATDKGFYATVGGTFTRQSFDCYMDSVPFTQTEYQRLSLKKDNTARTLYVACGYEYDDKIYLAAEMQYAFSKNSKSKYHPSIVGTPTDQNAASQKLSFGDDISLLLKIGKTINCVTPYAIAGIHINSVTHSLSYPYDQHSTDTWFEHDRSFRKKSFGFVGGFGVKHKSNDKLSIGADIMWKWLQNLTNNHKLSSTTSGNNIDEVGFNRIYCAKHKTNTNFSIYVTTKIF